VATGWYTDRDGNNQGLIETLANGTWTARRAPLPGDARPRPIPSRGLPTTNLLVVRCTAVGSCVATGNYADRNGPSQGLIETLSDGTWTADRAPLPADAATDPVAYLWAIACPAPGSCLAAGHYTSRSGQGRDPVVTLSGGTWMPTAAPLPADAAASQKWDPSDTTGLTAVGCRAPGNCVAAGSYFGRNGALQGVIDQLSGGSWTAARAALPAGAAEAKQYVFFDSAACPNAGTCFLVGGYQAQNGGIQPLIETGSPRH